MRPAELAQLELFAQIDELLRQLSEWMESRVEWPPLDLSRALLRRALPRLEQLRIRLEAPLVVATFGGTGTGKSALVNALVGVECTRSGRERPTTRRPILLAHPGTELSALNLPLEQFEVTLLDTPQLRDVVILDCPDPDTSDSATSGSNLAMLRSLLPFCDVLIYTATQQKYRSARIMEELDVASTGCRLLFVQTHADEDEDIREDWRNQLRGQYEVPDMFFVDSVQALREQQTGHRPTGDFARLQDLLTTRLAAVQRVQVRRANLLDLAATVLTRCEALTTEGIPGLEQLRVALDRERQEVRRHMTETLRPQLEACQHLWEQRILATVTARIGITPFSSLLRLYNGLGTLLASASLYRARSGAQLLLVGAVQGTRWWSARQKEREAEDRFEQLAGLNLEETRWHEAQLVVRGHLHDAGLPAKFADSTDSRRQNAAQVEAAFLESARKRVESAIQKLATRNSGWLVRCLYEFLLLAFLGYVLFRAGKNFFWDTFVDPDARILPIDFYVSAGLFFLLWSSLLVMAFARRMRRGLRTEIARMAEGLAADRPDAQLFPQVDAVLGEIDSQVQTLRRLHATCRHLRHELATSPELGSQKLAAAFAPSALPPGSSPAR